MQNMYFTSGGEGKLYFVIFFNKPSNNFFYKKPLFDCMGDGLVVQPLTWTLGFQKGYVFKPTYGPSTTNLDLGLPMALLG